VCLSAGFDLAFLVHCARLWVSRRGFGAALPCGVFFARARSADFAALVFWSNDRGPHVRTDQVILLWLTQITARWLLLERGVRKRGESLL